ncbi:6626_t:CDS:2 [Gigaspora margarita]|uniref:6626_t:CDS:1 n=1 Tax=Gigaspora margarita TaxID=4874 RepID=A0ABN7V296_GIGMA|nr:6626_t:CDS:2 [Gigaspora margarita]
MSKFILNGKLDIEPLISTRDFLQKGLKEAKNEFEIAGLVQAFEKILTLRGLENLHSPKKVFRAAGLEGLIPDYEIWHDYTDKRNITSHEYEQNIMEKKHPYSFYAYGSRVKGEARRLSDLDICYYDNIPLSTISEIKEEFEESNLPFEVELVA